MGIKSVFQLVLSIIPSDTKELGQPPKGFP